MLPIPPVLPEPLAPPSPVALLIFLPLFPPIAVISKADEGCDTELLNIAPFPIVI